MFTAMHYDWPIVGTITQSFGAIFWASLYTSRAARCRANKNLQNKHRHFSEHTRVSQWPPRYPAGVGYFTGQTPSPTVWKYLRQNVKITLKNKHAVELLECNTINCQNTFKNYNVKSLCKCHSLCASNMLQCRHARSLPLITVCRTFMIYVRFLSKYSTNYTIIRNCQTETSKVLSISNTLHSSHVQSVQMTFLTIINSVKCSAIKLLLFLI